MSFHHASFAARFQNDCARRRLLCSASIVALAFAPMPALAQTFIWGGTGSTTTTADYNSATNWSGNTTVPAGAGQNADFAGSGAATVIVTSASAPDYWMFDVGSQSYNVSGQTVTFGTQGLIDDANATQAIAIDNVLAGGGGISFNDATGTLTLTGNNTYSGTTTIVAGTLNIGNGGASGTLGTGSVTDDGALNFSRNASLTISNNISGTGSVQFTGTTFTVSGTNSYQGATSIVSGATLAAGSTTGFSSSSAFTVAGTLDLNGNSNSIKSLAGSGSVMNGFTGLYPVQLTRS